MHAAARISGRLTAPGLTAPVEIVRDDRDIPHIRARSLHDLFFAQGFVEGSDRLFQMDLLRRFVYGQLSEVLGPRLLSADERARAVPVREIVARQWQRLTQRERADLRAFSDGVNLAMRTQPLPVEFRVLLYHPRPWTGQDSLAVGFATVLDLIDSWNDVVRRDRIWRRLGPSGYDAYYPLTDPKYDVPIVGRERARRHTPAIDVLLKAKVAYDARPPVGSNQWAAGGAHTRSGRALLANDPHLSLNIPGVWYLVDLHAPGFNAAGASLTGTPGVILGHDANVAWGATNGTVASLSVFDAPPDLPSRYWQKERFRVRFAASVTKEYYRAPREFGVQVGGRFVLVRWSAYAHPRSPVPAFLALDRAHSIEEALRALASYPGPTQNFVLADTSGRVAYQLAGRIPDDPAWGRYVHPASDLDKSYPPIPFARLPHVPASKSGVVFTANNKMYGSDYRYRLSPAFTAPYRAYRIRELLRARKTYDVAYFARMQMDTFSPADLEFARLVNRAARLRPQYLTAGARSLVRRLRGWNGHYDPSSRAATLEHATREQLVRAHPAGFEAMLQAIRGPVNDPRAPGNPFLLLAGTLNAVESADGTMTALNRTWGAAAAQRIRHQLAPLGVWFLNGALLPGDGDTYTIHVQTPGFSQSFRAVWEVGNWNAGGIVIPSGESGEPGSRHYTDQSKTWIAGTLVPLPFGEPAVTAARGRLTLLPLQDP